MLAWEHIEEAPFIIRFLLLYLFWGAFWFSPPFLTVVKVGILLKLVCHSSCLAPIILFAEILHKIKHPEFNHKYFFFEKRKQKSIGFLN